MTRIVTRPEYVYAVSDIKTLLTLVAEGILSDQQFRLAVFQVLQSHGHRLPDDLIGERSQ